MSVMFPRSHGFKQIQVTIITIHTGKFKLGGSGRRRIQSCFTRRFLQLKLTPVRFIFMCSCRIHNAGLTTCSRKTLLTMTMHWSLTSIEMSVMFPRRQGFKQIQGIGQFGTDLSMIHQLFPGRSLEQIKSKFKKEQKQNPFINHEAQTTKAPDHSCFELVIKTLEEAAKEAEKEYAEDNLAHPKGRAEESIEINVWTCL